MHDGQTRRFARGIRFVSGLVEFSARPLQYAKVRRKAESVPVVVAGIPPAILLTGFYLQPGNAIIPQVLTGDAEPGRLGRQRE
jgi:hypothetical protein